MLLLVVLAVSVGLGQSCSPAPWFVFLTYDQVMYQADLVLHGRDVFHTMHRDPVYSWINRTHSIFKVFCVLKNVLNKPVNEYIKIRRIYPRIPCGTPSTQIGEDYIVLLRRIEGQVYEWKPVKALHRAAYEATDENLNKTMKICGYQNPTFPVQYGNKKYSIVRCPKVIADPNKCIIPTRNG